MFEVYDIHDRIDRLPHSARRAMAWVIVDMQNKTASPSPSEEELKSFLLPMAEMGLTMQQMLDMTQKVPKGWPFDHREIYFDFRLQRWMRILDAPTIDECLEDYVQHAPSQAEALTYLEERTETFFSRYGVKNSK
jgi:hypothetical protein